MKEFPKTKFEEKNIMAGEAPPPCPEFVASKYKCYTILKVTDN